MQRSGERQQPRVLAVARTALALATALGSGRAVRGDAPGDAARGCNLILGTQTFGVRYTFTPANSLLETANRIRAMGSSCIKLPLNDTWRTEHFADLPARDDIRTLTDLVAREPSFKAVFDMPFADILAWAYPLRGNRWDDGFSPEERAAEYREIYELAAYLLRTYSGSGKRFYLGNWEGDWHILRAASPDPVALRFDRMAEWFEVRQRAVQDARRDVAHTNVNVYHYIEVVTVKREAMQGKPAIASRVLPRVEADFLSYSCYETQENLDDLRAALAYLEQQFRPTPLPEWAGRKRIFIGEFGFPADRFPPRAARDRAADFFAFTLEWGCPFVLWWELYCNEVRDAEGRDARKRVTRPNAYRELPGAHFRGWWLVDANNVEQPLYNLLAAYNREARAFVADYAARHGRPPPDAEFRRFAAALVRRLKVADAPAP